MTQPKEQPGTVLVLLTEADCEIIKAAVCGFSHLYPEERAPILDALGSAVMPRYAVVYDNLDHLGSGIYDTAADARADYADVDHTTVIPIFMARGVPEAEEESDGTAGESSTPVES